MILKSYCSFLVGVKTLPKTAIWPPESEAFKLCHTYRLPNPSQFSGGKKKCMSVCELVFSEGDRFSQMFKSLLWCNAPSHLQLLQQKRPIAAMHPGWWKENPSVAARKILLILSKQRKNISHQKGTPENHRLKSTLLSDMLVLRRVYKVWWKHITIDIDSYLIAYLTSVSAVWTVFCRFCPSTKGMDHWQVPPQGHEFFDRSPNVGAP